ncbi:MAG: 50S ribosomal protein L29 [Candidatus Woesearchaeota archaeon]|nr:50S ribosomal protein L29 [Candidatus Woesearchaeota archaeon]
MALKTKDIREMGKDPLLSKIVELRKELVKLNAQVHTGTVPKNAGQLKLIKKTIAKILTIMNEKKKGKEESKKE